MNRLTFFKKLFTGAAVATVAPSILTTPADKPGINGTPFYTGKIGQHDVIALNPAVVKNAIYVEAGGNKIPITYTELFYVESNVNGMLKCRHWSNRPIANGGIVIISEKSVLKVTA